MLGARRRTIAVAAVLLSCCVAGHAAGGVRGDTAAVIVYVEGNSLSVVDIGGVAVRTDPEDPLGFELVKGDTLVTEQGTFVELQLVPSANVVKVAENTNFVIEERSSAGGGTFGLVYGKVRARVQKLTDQDRFTIRSLSAVAGVRGTDFGVSVELPRDEAGATAAPSQEAKKGPAVTQVFCFDGEVEVTPASRAAAAGALKTPVVIKANEMVSVSSAAGATTEEVKTEILPAELRSYWQKNDFKTEPMVVAAAPVKEQPTSVVAVVAPPAREEPKVLPPVTEDDSFRKLVRRYERRSDALGATAVLLSSVGGVTVTLGLLGALLPPTEGFDKQDLVLVGAGGLCAVGGIICTISFSAVSKVLRELRRTGKAP